MYFWKMYMLDNDLKKVYRKLCLREELVGVYIELEAIVDGWKICRDLKVSYLSEELRKFVISLATSPYWSWKKIEKIFLPGAT